MPTHRMLGAIQLRWSLLSRRPASSSSIHRTARDSPWSMSATRPDPLRGLATGEGRHLHRVSTGHGRHGLPPIRFLFPSGTLVIHEKSSIFVRGLHGGKMNPNGFARCGFPTGKPAALEGLDRSRGPRLPGYILLLRGGRRPLAMRAASLCHPGPRLCRPDSRDSRTPIIRNSKNGELQKRTNPKGD